MRQWVRKFDEPAQNRLQITLVILKTTDTGHGLAPVPSGEEVALGHGVRIQLPALPGAVHSCGVHFLSPVDVVAQIANSLVLESRPPERGRYSPVPGVSDERESEV
jgi:hypothetical protein